ncbi:MAG: HDIG domain-containing protein [Prevotella sp.]|nr:HDIG domain-containing protein [Prevotella sp.]
MARYNITENKSWRNRIVRIGVVCASIILILWFMPRGAHQQLQYDLNTPWKSELLMARHPFVVNKTTEAIEKEKDSVRRNFQPYYKYARSESQKRVKGLKGYLERHHVDESLASVLTERLENIYTAGIMDTAEYKQLMTETDKHVRYLEDGDTVSHRVSFTFTPTAAIELLLNDPRMQTETSGLDTLNIALFVKPNLIYDEGASQHELDSLLATVSPFTNDTIKEGQKIIDRGEMVDAERAIILQSYIDELERQTSMEQRSTTFIGQLMFVVMMIVLYTFYLYLFRKDYFYNPQATMMLYSVITLFPVVVSLMMRNNILNIYLLPLSMVPIFVRVFMDSRTAFFTHVIMILLCSLAVGYHYEFIVIQLVAGLVAIYSLRELSSRSQLFKSALLVTAAAILICFAIQLIQTDNIDKLGGYMYKYLIVSGILLLLSYPLMYVFEKLFGFTSDVSLFEISDTNRGALRELSEVAPGTFQHSITVGNLAAEIARRIGANALLVRTGALYHDIGKMADPVYFTENQAGVSPHDDMPYTESARKIISHVTEGVKIADRYGLPQFIKDFILTHHGTGMAKYFYIKYQNEHPDEEVDPRPFSYPGPDPFTREQAVLMMADGVEAASRSLTDYTEENISGLVNRLIDGMVQAGYFANCPITFLDIKLSKQVLIERLKALYHTRIAYPEAQKETSKTEGQKEP